MHALTTLVALLAAYHASPANADDLRVLFLGNSYTYVNDLPALVAALGAAGGHTIAVDSSAPGGNTLGAPQANGSAHAVNPVSLGKIAAGGWDFVVLQEQSYLPTIPQAVSAWMLPGAQTLDAAIHAASPSARTLLFETWGRANGGGTFCSGSWCSPNFTSFDAMQSALSAAYASVATDLAATVCPVGSAWQDWLAGPNTTALHAADQSHPALAGSYLAACCFYVSITGESPIGLGYTAGLAAPLALALQETAHDAVFGLGCGATSTVPGDFELDLVAGGGIGFLARFAVDGPYSGAPLAALAVAAGGADLPVPGGILGLDLATLLVGPNLSTLHQSGVGVLFGVLVPPDPALIGATVHVQGAAVVGGDLVLSNALAWRLCP